ncbi:MAG: hypothetical protein SCARUB_00457 [Candidatus Scalindua rubra]|uniref:Toluene tolerance protein n=1 Tax=Candidatus Scalindua rubra TaxID=1872076 RepID=A0A1E3XFM3_9BACT|nr:MAG: hypothetical protein SCARUB_00457 [Candidatus Scalindua rubra]
MKKISCLLLFLLLTQVAVADDVSEAEKKLKTSVNKVLTVLSDQELTKDEKRSIATETINSTFDFPLMAKLCLGKKYWSKLNSEQRTEFTNLFIKLFEDFFADKMEIFSDEKVVFKPLITKKKKVHIPTVLLSKGKEYSILYKMFKSKKGWKVYDVEIEGVSIIHSYRSQYQHALESGKIEDLLSKMREIKLENKNL